MSAWTRRRGMGGGSRRGGGSSGRLLVEFVAIALAVFLGLWANEWWEGRENAALARRALADVRTEVERNRMVMAERAEYHESVLPRLETVAERVRRTGAFDPAGDAPLPRGLHFPILTDAAWESARVTGALEHIDFSTVSLIAAVYSLQERLREMERQVASGALSPETLEPANARNALRFTRLMLNDVIIAERELLELYDRARARIDERLDGPATAEPASGTSRTSGAGASRSEEPAVPDTASADTTPPAGRPRREAPTDPTARDTTTADATARDTTAQDTTARDTAARDTTTGRR